MPRLSVLMPVHNGGHLLAIALRSTLRAMPPDAELVVYDDASTDDSAARVEAWADHRVRLVRGERNVGVAGALNVLLDSVDAEWVARMDADDVCLPWRFGWQRRAALSRQADLVFGNVVALVDGRRVPRPPKPTPISPSAMPLHLVLNNPVAHSTMFGRLASLRDVGGYRTVIAEDYDLWLRLAAAGVPMLRTTAPVLGYRFHAGQVTASPTWSSRPPLEPEVEVAYRALCERVLGQAPQWFPNPRRNRQAVDRLQAMVRAVEAASAGLGPVERRLLSRKARGLLRYAV